MSVAYANVLQYYNVALTCVFAVEAVVKLIGFGFYVSVLCLLQVVYELNLGDRKVSK